MRKNINKGNETNSKLFSKGAKKAGTKKKKAKVVMPKLSNLHCPSDMSLEEWQVALRQQQAKKDSFVITQVDE